MATTFSTVLIQAFAKLHSYDTGIWHAHPNESVRSADMEDGVLGMIIMLASRKEKS